MAIAVGLILLLAEVSHKGHHTCRIGKPIESDFHHRSFVAFPIVELAHCGEGRHGVGLVENRHVRTVDAANFEAAHANVLFEEVGKNAITYFQVEIIGLFARDEQIVGRLGAECREAAFDQR